MTRRIGSVCSGYRGLDMAVEAVFGGTTAWVSDNDPGASRILAHHWPGVPNLGDLTVADWAGVEPVDIVCGGYPCQPFSNAGKRLGVRDERHIWPDIARALGVLRPRIAVFENVAGHLRLGFDTVLADLAGLGFDVEWCVVRASEVGAPHQRRRLIILATATDAADLGHQRAGVARPRWDGPPNDREPAANGQGTGLEGAGVPGRPAVHGRAAADAASKRRGTRRTEPAGQQGRPGATCGGGAAPADADSDTVRQQPVGEPRRGSTTVAELAGPAAADPEGDERGRLTAGGRHTVQRRLRPDPDGRGPARPADPDSSGQRPDQPDLRAGQPDAAWGRFAPAIRRWEAATGRPAPRAVDDRRRLSPAFVEWLMGLPAGHVTDVPDLTRTQQLHALGNGVVPQQATAALRLLADRAAAA